MLQILKIKSYSFFEISKLKFLGFSKIYLYFDFPNDPDIEIAMKYPRDKVKIIVRDSALEELWKKSKSKSVLLFFCS